MKYYKSKRGYFYKIVGDKKTRVSAGCKKHVMKGGFTKDGEVEANDFHVRNVNDVFPKQRFISNNNEGIELQYMNPTGVGKYNINEYFQISILFNKNGIPHIFFDYNKATGKYNYVIYYKLFHKVAIFLEIKKIDKYGIISNVGFFSNRLFRVPDKMILLLCNKFLLEYERNRTDQMTNMYNLLKTYFDKLMKTRPDIFKSSNTTSRKLAEEILSKFQIKPT